MKKKRTAKRVSTVSRSAYNFFCGERASWPCLRCWSGQIWTSLFQGFSKDAAVWISSSKSKLSSSFLAMPTLSSSSSNWYVSAHFNSPTSTMPGASSIPSALQTPMSTPPWSPPMRHALSVPWQPSCCSATWSAIFIPVPTISYTLTSWNRALSLSKLISCMPTAWDLVLGSTQLSKPLFLTRTQGLHLVLRVHACCSMKCMREQLCHGRPWYPATLDLGKLEMQWRFLRRCQSGMFHPGTPW